MAAISGKDGSVMIVDAETTIKSWSLSYAGDALETSNFDDSSGGRTYIPGLTGWSGSFEGFYSTGNKLALATTGYICLKTSTGAGGLWSGTMFLTGMDVGTPKDGLVTQSYTFQGTGLLSNTS